MHICYNCSRFTAVRVAPHNRVERLVFWIAGGCYKCLCCKFRFYGIL